MDRESLLATNLLMRGAGYVSEPFAPTEGNDVIGKRSKWLSMIFVCSFAVLCLSGARAQADPVAQDVTCPNDICDGSSANWNVLTLQNLPTLGFANSGGAESKTAWLVLLAPGGIGPGLNFTLSAAAAVDNGLRTTPEPGMLALVGSGLLLLGVVLRKKIPGAES